jgi:hypothetical protein
VCNAALPITLIIFGAIGLGWHIGLFPTIESPIGIVVIWAGMFIVIWHRISRSFIVLGLMLILVGACAVLHDFYELAWALLIPILLILLGVLMLFACYWRAQAHRVA